MVPNMPKHCMNARYYRTSIEMVPSMPKHCMNARYYRTSIEMVPSMPKTLHECTLIQYIHRNGT